MAEIKLLKISSNGVPQEFNSASDQVTLASFTVQGGGPVLNANLDMNSGTVSDATSYAVTAGGPVLGANLDMNTGTISDATSYAVTTPASQGLVTTVSSPLAFDNVLRKEGINIMTTAGDILFPAISDSSGQVDAFRLPTLAGAPSATPTTSGEGYLVFDSTGDTLYIWNGSAWTSNFSTASSTPKLINTADFVAGVGGVSARDVVYCNLAGTVIPADNASESASRVIGFATNTAIATAAVSVQEDGVLGGFTALTAASRYYLGTAGAITATVPSASGAEVVQVGYAASTTKIKISFQHLGLRA